MLNSLYNHRVHTNYSRNLSFTLFESAVSNDNTSKHTLLNLKKLTTEDNIKWKEVMA